jgi:hypothetical protein
VEKEKLLCLPDFQVVALLSLLEELQVLLHGVFVGESDTTDTLKGIIVLVTEEVCGRVLAGGGRDN